MVHHGGRTVRGFTLMEVMIALMIFGLLAMTVQQVTSGYMGAYNRLEGQVMATWIAQNRMAEMRMQDGLPGVSESTDELEFGPWEWEIETVISVTEDPAMRRVDLTIGRIDPNYTESRQQLVFTGYLGEH